MRGSLPRGIMLTVERSGPLVGRASLVEGNKWPNPFLCDGIADVQRGETNRNHGIYRRPDPAPQAALGRRPYGRLQAHRRLEDHLSGRAWIVVPYSPPVAAGALGEPKYRVDLAGGGSRDQRFQGRHDYDARARAGHLRARLPVADC